MRRLLLTVCGSLPVLAPRVASACAVCGGFGQDGSRIAYILTTVLLSVLPLAMFGSFLFYIRKRIRQASPAVAPVSARDGRFGVSAGS